MNGVMNGMFIIILLFMLVAVDYLYTIADIMVDEVYNKTNTTYANPITDYAYTGYGNARNVIYTAITGVLVPFLIVLSFGSSFVNRNQSLTTYLVYSLLVVLFTPIAIYVFSDILTNMLNIPILNPSYMATTYFNNMLYILVANMLLSLASFVFIVRGGTR